MLDHVFTDAISALRDAFEAAFLERQAFEEHFQVDVLLGDVTWETSYGLAGRGQLADPVEALGVGGRVTDGSGAGWHLKLRPHYSGLYFAGGGFTRESGAELVMGSGRFVGPRAVEVALNAGGTQTLRIRTCATRGPSVRRRTRAASRLGTRSCNAVRRWTTSSSTWKGSSR